MSPLGAALLHEVEVRVSAVLLVHPLLLDLDELLLHGVVGAAQHWGGEHGEALLFEDLIDLAVLAADVEQDLVLLRSSIRLENC